MAHYAKVLDGKVTNVIVAEASFFNSFIDSEPGEWIQCSFNMRAGVYLDPATGNPADDQSVITGNAARERKNYPGIGWNYDATADMFYDNKPFPSWVLNNSTGIHEAPVDKPADYGTVKYYWDESAYQADTADPKTAGWVQKVGDD